MRKTIAIAAALLAVGLGSAACRDQAATPASSTPSGAAQSSGASQELDNIQTTLDAIDSEVAGDGSG